MTKKLLCVIVLMFVLVSALASCGGDNTPTHTHSFGKWTTTKNATCKEAGTEKRYCDCGESQTRDISKLTTHTWVDATYTAPKTCSVCGTTEGNPLAAHTHSFGEWKTTKNATCKEAGTEARYCDCGESQTREISKTEHEYGEWIVTKEATAIEKGLEERCCACGEKEIRELDCVSCDVSGIHTYVEGACIGCGLKIFDVLKAYIIANADKITGDNRHLCYYGDYNNDTNFTIFEYDTSKNRITILARHQYLLHTFSTDIYITPYSLEDGEYEWEGSCIKWPSDDCIDLSGYLDPSKFSSSTARLPHSSSGSKADNMAENYANALHINIREEIITFLNDVGYNISLSDLGFTRYN